MIRDEILSHPCRVLTPEQREARAAGHAAPVHPRTRAPAGS